MLALTWQGRENVSVEEVPDPRIEQPNDAIIKVTSTAICGSDLHLYTVLGPYLHPGDVLGHETMGIVEEVGPEAGDLQVGDRVGNVLRSHEPGYSLHGGVGNPVIGIARNAVARVKSAAGRAA
ncbi:alcohol dehydrogenase catalytic domain-containing protein [Aeromicrobium chenweiae]|uniref:alcohol dehydrogenase catalytic domain-containing protein n=1 Tax=Aeromicrobium chenweiae TaxID=2079793 RepID=UPI0018FFA6E0|nr:alcohol dehydrogenase catalytic domain-containing protein [Aeromicrobium chenweiae]